MSPLLKGCLLDHMQIFLNTGKIEHIRVKGKVSTTLRSWGGRRETVGQNTIQIAKKATSQVILTAEGKDILYALTTRMTLKMMISTSAELILLQEVRIDSSESLDALRLMTDMA